MKRADEKKAAHTKEYYRLHSLRWRLTLFVFGVLLMSGLLTAFAYVILLSFFRQNPVVLAITVNPFFAAALLLCSCSVFGTLLAAFFGKHYLRPLHRLIQATREVRRGNFKVTVKGDKGHPSEMGTLIRSFNEMVRELDGIELFRTDFINNFSHEFKTPIVSIRGFARELERGDLDEETRLEYARIIAEESDRLARLSISVLDLSKLENQQIVTDKTEFRLDEQIRQSILVLEPEWSRKNLEILPELARVEFYSNEEMLSHVWRNLIGNAVKFTPEGGEVRVLLTADEREVTVTVEDTGIGMNEETKERIFEKFYQGDPSHHRQGYGIGLTTVRRVIQLCHGSIRVESEVGVGSRFIVTLPREKREP